MIRHGLPRAGGLPRPDLRVPCLIIPLTPPESVTLEFALEYIGPDELVEVTPDSIRVRKRLLHPEDRRKARKDRRS